MIQIPPLLADLVKRAVSRRPSLISNAEIVEFATEVEIPPSFVPDALILGPAANSDSFRALMRRRFPGARILAFSADLARIAGPHDDEEGELSLDELIERLGL